MVSYGVPGSTRGFGFFAAYFPELFPTTIRATDQGFCWNMARATASLGPLIFGALVGTLGSVAATGRLIAGIYILGMIPTSRRARCTQPIRVVGYYDSGPERSAVTCLPARCHQGSCSAANRASTKTPRAPARQGLRRTTETNPHGPRI